ncbi:unnamed protein product, partial [Discosporangium mesarthrocarpum]
VEQESQFRCRPRPRLRGEGDRVAAGGCPITEGAQGQGKEERVASHDLQTALVVVVLVPLLALQLVAIILPLWAVQITRAALGKEDSPWATSSLPHKNEKNPSATDPFSAAAA